MCFAFDTHYGVCIIISIHVPTVVCIYCVQYMSTYPPLGVGADLSCPFFPHNCVVLALKTNKNGDSFA